MKVPRGLKMIKRIIILSKVINNHPYPISKASLLSHTNCRPATLSLSFLNLEGGEGEDEAEDEEG